MKITIIQTSVNEKNSNINHTEALHKIAEADDCDLIILPELFISGYNSVTIRDTALHSSSYIEDYCLLAQKKQTAILAGTLAVKKDEKTFNRSLFINKEGVIIAAYDKIHLFRLLNEDKYFSAGDRAVFFDYLGWRIGLLTCYDLRFPELARILALKGCNLLVIPSAWPQNRIAVFKQLSIARAIENQLWVVAVNRASNSERVTYGGNSLIIAPDGEIFAEAGVTEQIIQAEINLDKVSEYRKTIPCFTDRREDVYCINETFKDKS